MNPRVCMCCGEPMPETGNALSRNPNICASCSSMADGMDDSNLSDNPSRAVQTEGVAAEPAEAARHVAEPAPRLKAA